MSYNYDGDGQPCCPTSRPCSAHDVLEPCPHICPACAKCPDCCDCHDQLRAWFRDAMTDAVRTNRRILRSLDKR